MNSPVIQESQLQEVELQAINAALFLRHDDPRRPPVAVGRRALPHHTALSGASP